MTTETIHDEVRAHYAAAAIQASTGESCCSTSETIGPALYSALERDELPEAAVLASLGCSNPIAVAELHEGERVLDLGSGGGIDVRLSAKRVGPTGRAIGLDMTERQAAHPHRCQDDGGRPYVRRNGATLGRTPGRLTSKRRAADEAAGCCASPNGVLLSKALTVEAVTLVATDE